MSNGTSNQQKWSSTQAYTLAAICLLLGLAVGYLLRGSAGPAQPQAASVQEQAPSGMPPSGAQPSQADLKRMADTQAAPLLMQLKTDPNNPELLANAGNLYYDAQQYRDAIDYYQRALNVRPDNPDVRTDMGTAYFYLGDPDRALKEFDVALKSSPNHANTLFNMGMVKWQGKMDVPGAVAAWQKLLDTNPAYPNRDKVENLIKQAKQHTNVKPGQKTDKPAM
jgi:cytochrome c-type biogenesis protein CcmH/NrfG